jgi:hypothetical protein
MKKKRIIKQWVRCLMELRLSPYICTRAFTWCEENIWGDRGNPTNPLHWDRVLLNLPGLVNYNPAMPWVCCLRKDGRMAGYFGTYVDDI